MGFARQELLMAPNTLKKLYVCLKYVTKAKGELASMLHFVNDAFW